MLKSETILEIKKYRPAVLRTGKEWFVEYYVFNPELQKMSRRKIKVNHIEKVATRRQYAEGLIRRLNIELEKGWNPFIEEQSSKSYSLLTRAIDDFLKLNRKKFAEGDIRKETIQAYESYMKILKEYIVRNKYQDMYVYNFNKDFILKFLDYIYYDLERKGQTRDNYLGAIRVLCTFLVDRNYIKVRPTEGIAVLGKKKRGEKNRTVIDKVTMNKISAYCRKENPHFLLACKILYFCMVRPKEMSYLKIQHINLKNGTIFIPGDTSKNHKDGLVTMPKDLISLISELRVLDANPEWYLFSDQCKPGKKWHDEKQFRDYWNLHVRADLKLPATIKFYSLKDTGITDMIRKYNDPIIARDQARHSDLSITNIYTPSDMMRANDRIKNDTGKF
jgi:integrase